MNHTKYIFTILFLAIAQFASAQKKTIPYEKLESFSNTISDLQIKANGRIIKHSNGNKEELAFKKDNFKIWSYNNLVTWSFTTKVNGQSELLGITEEIDLSKAIGLILDNEALYIFFPQDLNIQVYVDDEVRTISRPVMDLYFNSNSADDKNKMFAYVYELISLLKIEKGLITKSEADNHLKEYRSLNPYEFYQKYPNSILAYKGKFLEEDYDRQIRFANEFIKRYPIPSLRSESPNYRKTYEMSIKNKIKQGQNFISNVNVQPAPFPATINSVTYTILISKNYQLAQQKYDEIISELTKNFDREFIEGQDQPDQYFLATKHVFFYSRAGAIGKNIPFEKVRNVRSVSVYFDKQTYKGEEWYEVTIYFS